MGHSTCCKMGPVQKLEGMLAAIAFAKLKLKVTARDFKNLSSEAEHSSLYSFKCLTNLIELILLIYENYKRCF